MLYTPIGTDGALTVEIPLAVHEGIFISQPKRTRPIYSPALTDCFVYAMRINPAPDLEDSETPGIRWRFVPNRRCYETIKLEIFFSTKIIICELS